MAFCGQCGILLPPKAAACPGCGAAVIPSWESADQMFNASTIISDLNKRQQVEDSSSSKMYFVQNPTDSTIDNSKTQRAEQSKNAPIAPPPTDYMTQISNDHFSTQGIRPPYSTSSSQEVPYPDYVSPIVPDYRPAPVSPQKMNNRGMLLITLLLFVLVAAITAVLVIDPNQILQMVRGSINAPLTTPAPPTPTAQLSPTREQQAQSVIDHYYIAINSKDYQTAYNLWVNNPDSYQKFADGFADTSHDNYTFGNVLQQSDGTVQIYITLVATSTSFQQTTYKGYFIAGQQPDASWKIISAHIHTI